MPARPGLKFRTNASCERIGWLRLHRIGTSRYNPVWEETQRLVRPEAIRRMTVSSMRPSSVRKSSLVAPSTAESCPLDQFEVRLGEGTAHGISLTAPVDVLERHAFAKPLATDSLQGRATQAAGGQYRFEGRKIVDRGLLFCEGRQSTLHGRERGR